jgi:hypothetical protein
MLRSRFSILWPRVQSHGERSGDRAEKGSRLNDAGAWGMRASSALRGVTLRVGRA